MSKLDYTPTSRMELFATSTTGYSLVIYLPWGTATIEETAPPLPSSVVAIRYHGREVAIALPATVDAFQLAAWYNKYATPLVARMLAGYSEEYDALRDHRYSVLNKDGQIAVGCLHAIVTGYHIDDKLPALPVLSDSGSISVS